MTPDVAWAYDRADRMTSRTADSVTVTYTYDANGDMLTASGPTGTITTGYDRLDRPVSVVPDDGSTTTTWTRSTSTGSITSDAGTFAYDLDRWGRETEMVPPLGGSHTTSYRADGQVRRTIDPNGNQTDRTYDDAGRLTAITTTDTGCTVIGGSVCAALAYTRNRAGLVRTEASDIRATGITDPANGTASFAYDQMGRLIGYDSPVASSGDLDYAWDAVLDRTGVTTDPSGTPATVTTTFDAADRPTSDTAGGTYGHDAQGRMTARPGRTMEWDSLGRLLKVRNASTSAVLSEYTYDALDRLREVTSSGTTTRFRYVGLSTTVARIWDATAGGSVKRYASGWHGELVGDFTNTSGNERTFMRNGHHDITWIANSTGLPVRTIRYDPHGGVIGQAGSGSSALFRFQSSWRDPATGMSWVITRWYAPDMGRFISEDSLLGEPRNPDSRHRYAYAEGDPVDGWDPDGRASVYPSFSNSRARLMSGGSGAVQLVSNTTNNLWMRTKGSTLLPRSKSDWWAALDSATFRWTGPHQQGLRMTVTLTADIEWQSGHQAAVSKADHKVAVRMVLLGDDSGQIGQALLRSDSQKCWSVVNSFVCDPPDPEFDVSQSAVTFSVTFAANEIHRNEKVRLRIKARALAATSGPSAVSTRIVVANVRARLSW